MIWFSSDLHLCHNKDFCFVPRGFKSTEEMNAAIIQRWNETVFPDDDVYVLGDLMLSDVEEGLRLLAKLNGYIHIIRGNHDTDTKVERYKELPNVVSVDYALEFKYKKAYFWLSHYPTLTANYDDDKPWAKHLINLYGHTHQQTNFYNDNPYMYHVGVDSHNCTPVSIDQIIEDIKKKKEELNNEQMARAKYGNE